MPAVLRARRGVAAVLVPVLATLAGVGWLYLLKDVGLLDAGPAVGGALPLERLAGDDAQPLLRVLAAWIPAAAAGAAALSALTQLRPASRGIVAGAPAPGAPLRPRAPPGGGV